MNTEPSRTPSYPTLLFICCMVVLGCYFGTYMRFPVVPLYAQTLGADTVLVGMINAAFLLGAGTLSLPLGLVVHRLGMKLLASVGLLMLALSSFLLALSHTPHQLIWIYLLSGAGLAAFGPTTMSYVAGISPPTHLGRSYGWYSTAIYTGMSLGPGAGGLVAEWWGFPPVFTISGVTILATLAGLWFFLPRARQVMPATPPPPALGRAVLREVSQNLPLLGAWLATAGGCFGLGVFLTFLPLHAHAQGLTYGQIGLVFAAQGILNALSRLPFGHLSDRVQQRNLLVIWGLLGIAVSLAGYGFSRRPFEFILTAVAMGLSMGLAFTSVAALTVETVAPELRGLAMGGYNSAIYLGMMVSSAGLGPIISRIGFRNSFVLTAVVTALLTGLSHLLMRSFSRPSHRPVR
ncbi:MAG: MFS transporter [Syntrophobacterales bacterium]|jgi:MFS family permease|nr:MFS transporter [Syntrophobacterales bacterium]